MSLATSADNACDQPSNASSAVSQAGDPLLLCCCIVVLLLLQFCYTGRMGLLGNLTTAQIVEQLVEARRWLAEYAAQQQQQPQLDGRQQQQQLEGDAMQQAAADVQQQADSSSSSRPQKGKKNVGWQAQPPRINNIVFMVRLRLFWWDPAAAGLSFLGLA